ncbi:hypothetical protein BU16DRAFT_545129 [Lophium mytilinum]|uniref:Uncharacterized protein n=1 Tax=Lophium mytilinum TaxID=390894 RepID=A0A6A6Q989_9PEZI|nr:hypothetical protein BU16DRAFT_545129 [Lophium mytilinum]
MARKGHSRELFEGETPPTSGPVPLTGLLRLKTNRNKGNKAWRPLEASDFDDDKDGDEQSVSSRWDSVEPLAHETPMEKESMFGPERLQTDFSQATDDAHLSRAQDRGRSAEPLPTTKIFDNMQSTDTSPVSNRTGGLEDEIGRVFGRRLPDPIHLQQVTGHEDGEVIFIGHPNRDVSAHQWSAGSFQWINIGQFSYNRRKVEGQLASDRLRGQTVGMSMPQNNLTYFKAIADQRYTLAKESANTHTEQPVEGVGEPAPLRARGEARESLQYLRRLTTESDRFGSLSGASTPTPGGAPLPNTFTAARGVRIGQAQQPTSTMRTVISSLPEDDPFVSTPTIPQKTTKPISISPATPFSRAQARASGMDYNFEFPPKTAASREADSLGSVMDAGARRDYFKKQEQARILQMQDMWPNNQHPAPLREILVGEEAASSDYIHQRERLRMDLAKLGKQADLRNPTSDYPTTMAALSTLRLDSDTSRPRHDSHVPPVPPGFEKAFPTPPTRPAQQRTMSTLNANAPPYRTAYSSHLPQRTKNDSPSAPTVAPVANLRVSDPDNVQLPVPEIATSVTQKKPIKQEFSGPFFMDTMPTSHAPTTPLAPCLAEEEKLQAWWTDGQRPARQQEYYKTIMSTSTTIRARNATLAPGGPISRGGNHKIADRLLIPLIENLREYVDEMNNTQSGGRDYFTRAFVPPPPYAVDRSGSGKHTFFGEDCGATPLRIGRDPRYTGYGGARQIVGVGGSNVSMRGAGYESPMGFQRLGLGGFGRAGAGSFGARAFSGASEREFGGMERLWE